MSALDAVTVTPSVTSQQFTIVRGRPLSIKSLSVNEVAEQVGVSPRTLRRHIADGSFPGFKVGRRYFVSPDALERFMNGGGL